MLRLLVRLAGFALIAIGLATVVAPGFAAWAYGVAATDSTALVYVRVAGLRDLAIGALFLFQVSLGATDRTLASLFLATAIIPAGDALVVWVHGTEGSGPALALHSSSFVAFVVLGLRALRSP